MSDGQIDCPDDVSPLAPSAKLVFFLVMCHGPITTSELSNWLPPRTVRKAVRELRDAGVVTTEPHPDKPNSRLVRASN